MPAYYVNKQAQPNGDHEVHKEGCHKMPSEENKLPLGSFDNCRPAVVEAKKHYPQSNGCVHCSPDCHTG